MYVYINLNDFIYVGFTFLILCKKGYTMTLWKLSLMWIRHGSFTVNEDEIASSLDWYFRNIWSRDNTKLCKRNCGKIIVIKRNKIFSVDESTESWCINKELSGRGLIDWQWKRAWPSWLMAKKGRGFRRWDLIAVCVEWLRRRRQHIQPVKRR